MPTTICIPIGTHQCRQKGGQITTGKSALRSYTELLVETEGIEPSLVNKIMDNIYKLLTNRPPKLKMGGVKFPRERRRTLRRNTPPEILLLSLFSILIIYSIYSSSSLKLKPYMSLSSVSLNILYQCGSFLRMFATTLLLHTIQQGLFDTVHHQPYLRS